MAEIVMDKHGWMPIGCVPAEVTEIVGWCQFPAGTQARDCMRRGDKWIHEGIEQNVTFWMPKRTKEAPEFPGATACELLGQDKVNALRKALGACRETVAWFLRFTEQQAEKCRDSQKLAAAANVSTRYGEIAENYEKDAVSIRLAMEQADAALLQGAR